VSWHPRFSPRFPDSGSPPGAGPDGAEGLGLERLVKYGSAPHRLEVLNAWDRSRTVLGSRDGETPLETCSVSDMFPKFF